MNILDEIAEKTRERVAEAKARRPLDQVRYEAETQAVLELSQSPEGRFQFPFESALRSGDIAFICEAKKASPSKGLIAEDFPYVEIAKEYEAAGAAAISCLTEPYWFLGSDRYLEEITQAVSIPVIRKDFTVDEYMIYEAKLLGASAVLLICAILDDYCLTRYREIAESLGMSALVEAHDDEEIRRAINAGARIIGVNNRNLKDFTVDVHNSTRYRSMVPEDIVFVSESGITTADDIDVLRSNGTNAVLIGETLMRAPDKKYMLDELRGMHRRKVKICGLKRLEDVDYVNKARPDYAGFVFAKKKRLVTPEFAAEMRKRLLPEIKSVGVFIDKDISAVADLYLQGIIDVIQLHGQEDAAYIASLRALIADRMTEACAMSMDILGRSMMDKPRRVPIIKAVRVMTVEDVRAAEKLDVDWLLLDNGTGGTGVVFDWNVIRAAEPVAKPFFLAGGLNRANISTGISILSPFGVDISSGVEDQEGFKDEKLILEIVDLARNPNPVA